MSELVKLSAAEMAAKIKAKEVSSRELIKNIVFRGTWQKKLMTVKQGK